MARGHFNFSEYGELFPFGGRVGEGEGNALRQGEADHSDPATEEWKKAFAPPGETERPPNYGAESHPSVTAKRVGPGGWTPADLPAAAAVEEAEEAEEAEPAAAEAGDGAPAAAAAEAAPLAPLD